jgi:glycosyltransferase involved in cell wall biosynthesis
MRVLQLLKTSTGGYWALRHMSRLVKMGVEVYVAMPHGGTLVPQYEVEGVKICYMDFSLKHFFRSCMDLRRIVKDVNPDIIHSHFVITTLIMRLALRDDKRPRIFQVPGPLHLENWFFRNIELILRQRNDYWIASCQWTHKRYLRSGIKSNRLFLSYYGMEFEKYNCYKPGKLRTELGLQDDDILIGIVAYFYAPKQYLRQKRGLKGHEDLIDAVAILAKKYPNLYCVCIGGAASGAERYEQHVKNYARLKVGNRVMFTGTRTDVAEIYNDMFCVVHPSHSENVGGAGESLLLGVPTITTNIGGFPDIVINEVTGLTVPPQDPHAIACAVESLIEGKCDIEGFIRSGKEICHRLIDVESTVVTLFNIYQCIKKL